MPTIHARRDATTTTNGSSTRQHGSSPRLGAGQALGLRQRERLEARFGRDLSAVRIHTDAAAAESARALGARAYTVGRDIVFGPGEYRPETRAGRRLLAHELAHVVQQGGRDAAPAGVSRDPAPEREAARVADVVAAGGAAPALAQRFAAPVIQTQDDGSGIEDQPAPQPVQGSLEWRSDMLGIVLSSSKTRGHDEANAASSCLGHAWPGQQRLLSDCGRFDHFCTTPATFPFEVNFYVDVFGFPRPGPFVPPTVEVAFQFSGLAPGGGSQARRERDTAPRYLGDGRPLEPSFGRTFSITSGNGGTLSITLGLTDPDSARSATYRDTIECRLTPCV